MNPIEPDPTYPAALVWFARLIVVGLVVLFVVELIQGLRVLFRRFRQ